MVQYLHQGHKILYKEKLKETKLKEKNESNLRKKKKYIKYELNLKFKNEYVFGRNIWKNIKKSKEIKVWIDLEDKEKNLAK